MINRAKNRLHEDSTVNHEYLPIRGNSKLLEGARKLVFGAVGALNPAIASIQTIAGTGANHIGARVLADTLKPKNVWLPDPTWSNHPLIWEKADRNIKQRSYPYYSPTDNGFDFNGMVKRLELESNPGDVLILHACAHNPTGLDPSRDQWKSIADLCIRLNLFPLFDSA